MLRAPVQISVTALDAVVRRENLGEMHLALRADAMWRDEDGQREYWQRAVAELTRLDLAGPRGLDPDFRDTLQTMVRPAEEFFGWSLRPEGNTAVLAAASGAESVVAVRRDDVVSIRPIRPGSLAELVVQQLPQVPAARGRSFNLPESATTGQDPQQRRDEGFGGLSRPQENPEIKQLEEVLKQERTGVGELHAAIREHSGRRITTPRPVSYFDTPGGRWMTQVTRARNDERWLVAAPASPQTLIGKLYEMQHELGHD